MRILHTSDWHLGHRLYDRDRSPEHRAALQWLLATIEAEGVDLLIVAGDVFDTMNPSNTAQELYYAFLGALGRTGCQAAVIVGGNHDSPSLLDAPVELLRQLNCHVVGSARSDPSAQVIHLRVGSREGSKWGMGALNAGAGEVERAVIVAAVPYLRDRDIKYSIAGESPEDRRQRMRAAILGHYQAIAAAVEASREDPTTPVIATGHLYAAGAVDAEDKETHIYLADKNNIAAEQFSPSFDYVALGHIHQAQRVGGRESVRYSGSLIPLTFGEARQPQSVCIFDLDRAGQEVEVRKIPVPRYRELVSVRGTAEEVMAALADLKASEAARTEERLPMWVEVRVSSPHPLPLLREALEDALGPADAAEAAGLPIVVRSSVTRPDRALETTLSAGSDLRELDPEDVFYRLCHGNADAPREDYPDLLASFRELRQWMSEEISEA